MASPPTEAPAGASVAAEAEEVAAVAPATPSAAAAALVAQSGAASSSDEAERPDTPTTAALLAPSRATPTPSRRLSPKDFMFGATLGEGAYARVVHARLKDTGDEYAVKIMEKRFIKKEGKVRFVMMEKSVLSKLSHPRIIKLFFTFQDVGYLYLVMELALGGELLSVIRKFTEENEAAGREGVGCPQPVTQFCVAEVVQALRYLHGERIVHRDLKPENILVGVDGHLKITDFGTAKDETEDGRQNTFCGTEEYVSPEVLRDAEATGACDLWALGCLLFQMVVGRPPFHADTTFLTFQEILAADIDTFEFPAAVDDVSKDLIRRLLRQEPSERLGAGAPGSDNDYDALQAHPFFAGVDWAAIDAGTAEPAYVPGARELPPITADGADEDWLFAGVATELQLAPAPRDIAASAQGAAPAQAAPLRTTPSMSSEYARFCNEGEHVLLSGRLLKRKGLFSKRRQLLLTSQPRLVYFDPVSMEQKGEIPWQPRTVDVVLRSATAFDVVTPGRVYHWSDAIQGDAGNAGQWVAAIREQIAVRDSQ